MKEKRAKSDRIVTEIFWKCVIISGIACLLYCLTSCKSATRVVEVEKVILKTDTTYIERERKDSIFFHDSIYVREAARGDTIYIEKEVLRTRYIERIARDTVSKISRDSVRVPVVVEKVVEKKVPRKRAWWEKLLLWMGGGTLLTAGGWMFFKFRKVL